MKVQSFWVVFSVAMLAALLATSFGSDGVVNEPDKVWQVRYHQTQKSKKTDDLAVRLKIEWDDETAGTIKGTLTRYDALDAGKTKYQERTGASGNITGLKGKITSKGGGNKRKREEFYLEKSYGTGKNKRTVKVQGFHHTGRQKDDRTDDSICIRVLDKADGTLAPLLTENCDEQPPDEDNLSEEDDTPDPPPYDGGCN